MDPALQTAGLAGLEFLIQKALELDPATAQRLKTLEGKVLLIHCKSPELKVFCLPGEQGMQLKSWHDESQLSGALRGPMSEFIKLLQSDDKAAALINGGLTVEGNSNDFIALQSILTQLDVDWEQPIAKVLGDVGGHQLGRLIRGGLAARKRLHEFGEVELERFLHQRAGVLPSQAELEQFYSDVANLRQRVERLQARIDRAKQAAP